MIRKNVKDILTKQFQEMPNTNEVMVSEAYADILIPFTKDLEERLGIYEARHYQFITDKYVLVHIPLDRYYEILFRFQEIDINVIPSVLGPYSIDALDASGVLPFHTHPFVPLRGSGVLIGFVDSGIDYTHPTFLYEDNTTKIVSIWDQTIEGNPPQNFIYGTEYTEEEINRALESENPYDIVPSRDDTGHGTFLAGIAAGRYVIEEGFAGAAPDAEILMVKVKEAKAYLKRDYLIREDAIVYANTDVILGIKYLLNKAVALRRPIVICIGLGTNIGGHDGTAIIEEIIAEVGDVVGVAIIVCAGNEANLGHHYLGVYPQGQRFQDVDIRIAPNEKGITFRLWASAPDIYSVGILSPMGEFISRLSPRIGQREEIKLLLERSRVYVEYQLMDKRTGDQMIVFRIEEPTPGIWTLRVYGDLVVSGNYNIWLPREGWSDPATQFLLPSPSMTVTIPGTNTIPITVGAYNHLDDSLYISSGRGPTRNLMIKPDLVAPGVNIRGPIPNNTYGTRTGTSISTAQVAGAAAILFEWGIVEGRLPQMDTRIIRKLLIRGATRRVGISYPNNEWGFGALNLLNSYELLRGTF
ncbi:subtilase family protein [Natranaerovirga pectinivora]|uniref:Subtilase family protein n=1 Tax=Natranaerovirga pectinivora TaxID=682400 RepID=A0A4R3MPU3_9FIRM|nr:S8 family peptidase [Natranaerovirga pectinivora]TCT16301.1 subtilase family protein [Natranaerovirga pectinivora]